MVAAAREVLERAGAAPGDVAHFVHGSTVATNALLERRLARTALRHHEGLPRPALPRPPGAPEPVPAARGADAARGSRAGLCVQVDERMGPHESHTKPLDEASVERAARRLARARVEAVAVCLLFAFRDPAHEARVAELLRAALPDAFVVASHEVAAEVREFERATTATVNAALGPPTGRYLARLRQAAEAAGLPEPHVMLSSGGVATLEQAAAHPAAMLLSGPAGGAVAARIVGEPPALGFDMVGTSTDATVLAGAAGSGPRAARSTACRSGCRWRTSTRSAPEAGRSPGSAAGRWVSARSQPAPTPAPRATAAAASSQPSPTRTSCFAACPPRRRSRPTSGSTSARRARRSNGLGIGSAEEAAEGVVAVAVNAMVQALRVVSVERGHDPAGATLIAFGGAGAAACLRAGNPARRPARPVPAGQRRPLGGRARRRRAAPRRLAHRPGAPGRGRRPRRRGRRAGRRARRRGGARGRRPALRRPVVRASRAVRGSGTARERLPRRARAPLRARGPRAGDRAGHAARRRGRSRSGVAVTATGDVERSRRAIRWDGDEPRPMSSTGTGLPPGTAVTGPRSSSSRRRLPGAARWAGGADEHGVLRLES